MAAQQIKLPFVLIKRHPSTYRSVREKNAPAVVGRHRLEPLLLLCKSNDGKRKRGLVSLLFQFLDLVCLGFSPKNNEIR
jgi:hypothetical protein